MENPLSVRANAFAIASIMSDPEAAAMLQAYGYNCGPRSSSSSSGDCRFQSSSDCWSSQHLQQQQQLVHPHQQLVGARSPGENAESGDYVSGLKGMEG